MFVHGYTVYIGKKWWDTKKKCYIGFFFYNYYLFFSFIRIIINKI